MALTKTALIKRIPVVATPTKCAVKVKQTHVFF